MRAARSGPWQGKQFPARIGRMSRLNPGAGGVDGGTLALRRRGDGAEKASGKREPPIRIVKKNGIFDIRIGCAGAIDASRAADFANPYPISITVGAASATGSPAAARSSRRSSWSLPGASRDATVVSQISLRIRRVR